MPTLDIQASSLKGSRGLVAEQLRFGCRIGHATGCDIGKRCIVHRGSSHREPNFPNAHIGQLPGTSCVVPLAENFATPQTLNPHNPKPENHALNPTPQNLNLMPSEFFEMPAHHGGTTTASRSSRRGAKGLKA